MDDGGSYLSHCPPLVGYLDICQTDLDTQFKPATVVDSYQFLQVVPNQMLRREFKARMET